MTRSVAVLSAFALLAASCSTQTSTGRKPAVSPSAQQPPAPKPVAHIGDTLNLDRIGGGKVAVTLVQVIDPATVRDGQADPGKTYIATKLTIANTGASTIVGDANNNVAVVGSDNQGYRADFAGVAECQNFVYGQFLIAPGFSATGCVVFALPRGVTPVKVKYMPSSGISQDVGEWLNRP